VSGILASGRGGAPVRVQATDIEAKKSFEKLADGWQRLAEQVLRVANSSDGNK
jgi:flagellin-like hook-associated protein FlgL